MKVKAVHIKASIGFLGLTPADLVLQAKTVHDSMPNNPLYTGGPVDAATLQAAIDAYIASAALATDSKKAVAEREKQRMTIIHFLRLLAQCRRSQPGGFRHHKSSAPCIALDYGGSHE